MKYMGSKRGMLTNGLGELMKSEAGSHGRVVDLFCGAASVSWFAAQNLQMPVIATDLQAYAVVLAKAVVERTSTLDSRALARNWFKETHAQRRIAPTWSKAARLDKQLLNAATWSARARELCGGAGDNAGTMIRSYGGHYYSPSQAMTFDAMMASLPECAEQRTACLAATIVAASKCAAAPGHTAQPFRASRTAGKFLREAWLRDPFHYAEQALSDICRRHATKMGRASVGDAYELAGRLTEKDLVFVDPPYSGVHYSRFYHVLETIARGKCGPVEGVGRYPPSAERPVSSFSRRSEAPAALETLLKRLASKGCTVILTFPAGECSNGLSGSMVEQTADKHFALVRKKVKTRFSTMGGNNSHRKARMLSDELILLLKAKGRK